MIFFQFLYSLFAAYSTLCHVVGVVVVTAVTAIGVQVARDPALRLQLRTAYRLAQAAASMRGGGRGQEPHRVPDRVPVPDRARVVMQPAATQPAAAAKKDN